MELESNRKAIKASLTYVLCSFLIKGVNFITTPFFSRILTQEEYGYISNFNSWMSIITIIASLSLIASLNRARFDYKENYKSYISSILIFGLLFSILFFAIIIFQLPFFEKLFSLDKKYILLMCFSVIAQPAYDIYLQNQRFEYKSKLVTILTVSMTLSSVFFSFLFINLIEDNAWGKTLGGQIPSIIFGLVVYAFYFRKSLTFNLHYCLYAISISIPYIFHLLSSVILGSSDRTMITQFCGTKANAIYSMAYNVGMIVNIIWQAFNQAYAPWLGERLFEKDWGTVKKITSYYLMVFSFIVIGMLLIAPEALLILGGKRYLESTNLIPPVMIAYSFVFIDSLYVNILQFEKKTFGMACATVSSALINLLLNYIFIPMFGYAVAAYTTVVGYFVLLVIDYTLVRKLSMDNIYNFKHIALVIMGLLSFSFLTLFMYNNMVIRYLFIIVYVFIFIILIIKYRKFINVLKS